MKAVFRDLIQKAIKELKEEGYIKSTTDVPIVIEYPDRRYGDYSTNIAFLIAKTERKKAMEIAEVIAGKIEKTDFIEAIEISSGGFINFRVKDIFWHNVLKEILIKKEKYGNINIGNGKKVNIEFVSANPTGPLHVGHARGAVVGDSLANLLKKAGYNVTKEYYINDAGRQVWLLGESIYARMCEISGIDYQFPEEGYKGSYIYELAKMALKELPNVFKLEKEEAIEMLSQWATNKIMETIKLDLMDLGVEFDLFFSEKKLYEEGEIEKALTELREKGFLYEEMGALWFRSTDFGDEKDRVVMKSDGSYTYFASDIAYHRNKFLRGYDIYINIWGADHHGYIKRVKGAIKALGFDDEKLTILLIQMVNLLKNGKQITMSKREGEGVTLRWLLNEVGKDATRFIFLTRKQDAHLDFDIDVAKKQTDENPVYYVQYAHARICSIRRIAEERKININVDPDKINYSLLKEEEEKEILRKLATFPDVIEGAVKHLEPHRITFYLLELASLFHTYYNRYRILEPEDELRLARFALAEGVRIVLKEGLRIIGVESKEVM